MVVWYEKVYCFLREVSFLLGLSITDVTLSETKLMGRLRIAAKARVRGLRTLIYLRVAVKTRPKRGWLTGPGRCLPDFCRCAALLRCRPAFAHGASAVIISNEGGSRRALHQKNRMSFHQKVCLWSSCYLLAIYALSIPWVETVSSVITISKIGSFATVSETAACGGSISRGLECLPRAGPPGLVARSHR